MDSVQQIYVRNQTPLLQTFRASLVFSISTLLLLLQRYELEHAGMMCPRHVPNLINKTYTHFNQIKTNGTEAALTLVT